MDNALLVQVISASLAPAVFVSGSALLVLAFIGRQGVLTGRLRELHAQALAFAERAHKEHDEYCQARADLALAQSRQVFVQAHTVKRVMICLFVAIALFLLSSVGLGAGVFFPAVIAVAVGVFALAMLVLLTAAVFALSAAMVSLTPLRDEEVAAEEMLKHFKDTQSGLK